MEATLEDNQPSAATTSEPPRSPNKTKKKKKHEHHSKRHRTKHHHSPSITAESTSFSTAAGGGNIVIADAEDWAVNHDRIERLGLVFPNSICCDCNENGTQWASVNHGVFICIRCAGVHRSLGVHVSKVKSTSMDRWTAAEVALMEAIGNRRGEALYFAHPPSTTSDGLLTRHSSNEEVKQFIKRKYVSKAFAVNNVEELLRKIYKQVGYQQPKIQESGLTASDGLKSKASDKVAAAAKKVDPEQVVRALYGDATTSELTSKIKTTGQKKETQSQTIHGTFGVVNVSSGEYLDRLTMVLRAFEIDHEGMESAPDVERNDEKETKLLD